MIRTIRGDRAGCVVSKGWEFGRNAERVRRVLHQATRHFSTERLEARVLLSVDMLQYHNDNTSSGVNPNETTLTLNNVNTGQFGKLFSHAVDGQVYAQPLVKTNVNITTGAHQGLHDVVYVATEQDSVYAFDAHTGVQLWHDGFTDPANGVTSVPFTDLTPNPDITPVVGITGTPVIDASTGTMYLVAKTKEVRNDGTHYVQKLHAINIASGAEVSGSPAIIGDTLYVGGADFTYLSGPAVNGTGDGNVNGVVTFNAMRELNRPGLVLANGTLYIAFGSHGDNGPYHGWVLGYNPSNLNLTAAWNSTPNGGLGGIWQGGGITEVDSNGNIYLETGNGSFDENLDANGFPSQGDYGDSIVKLVPDPTSTPGNQNINGWGLKVVDYFTPSNEAPLSASDADLGSGASMILPDSAGNATHPHLMIGGGKEGKLYLIDRDNMGKFDPNIDHVVQEIPGALNGMLDTPAFYNGTLYVVGGYGDVAKSYSISNAHVSTPAASMSADNYSFPGSTPSISYNSSNPANPNAIVWDIDRGTNELRAYDAAGYGNELWTSNQADTRDTLGSVVKFTVPTVINGMVYVGTANGIVAYGLMLPPTSAPATPSGLVAKTISASEIDLSWDLNSIDAANIQIERSTNGGPFTQAAVIAGTSTNYNDTTGLLSGTQYSYRVLASNIIGASGYSNSASATTRQTIYQDWTDADIGTPLLAGSASYNTGTFTVSGSGDDIWNNADSFHYVYEQLIGDGTITARLATQDYTDYWAKSGVMIRETPDADSAHAFMLVGAGAGADFQYRQQTGGGSSDAGGTGYTSPIWVRLTRSGDNFTGYVSFDGTDGSWQQVASVNIPMSTAVYAGLAVCSHNGGQLATSTFDNVSLVQNALIPPGIPTNVAARGVSGTQIAVTWADANHNSTRFTVERSSDLGNSYSVVGTTSKNSFIDSGLISGHTYYYKVSASNPAGQSDFSAAVNAVPPIPPLTPSGAHTTLIKSDEIDLAWTDLANNEDGYRIFRRLGSAGTFTLLAQLPPDSQSYIDNTLPPNTQVDYHIQAFNAAGYSDFAGVSTSTPFGPPVNITTRPGNQQVTIAWAKVNGATAYNLYRSDQPGQEGTTPYASNIAGNNFVDTGLSNGTVYYYRLSTIGPSGETNLSPEFMASAGPVQGVSGRYFNNTDWSGTPDAQGIVSNVDFSWHGGSPDPAIQTDNFSTEFTGKVHADVSGWYYFSSNTDDDGYLWVDGQLASEDPGGHGEREALYYGYVNPIHLDAGQNYNFIFRQIEGHGDAGAHMSWQIYGDDGSFTPLTIVPHDHLTSLLDTPAAPTNFAAPVVGSRSLSLNFTDNSTSEYGYLIERSDDGGAHYSVVNQLGMQENYGGYPQGVSYSDTNLQPSTTYFYKLVAFNPDGQTESQPLSVTTTAVPANSGLSAYFFKQQFWAGDPVVSQTVGQVDFAWGNTAPVPQINSQVYSSAFTGKVHIITEGYYYFLSNTADDGYLYVNGALVSSDPGVHGARDAWNGTQGVYLAPGDYNLVYLQNERGGGGGAAHLNWLSPDSFYTEQAIPQERLQRTSDLPDNPTDLRFSDRTADAVTLHWTDNATDEVYYDIERSTDGIHFTRVAELQPVSNPIYGGAGSGTFRDSGLSPDTRYYYHVIARNFTGTSAAAQGIVVSGNALTPPPLPVVDHSGGFSDAYNDLYVNWPAQVVGDRLRLTDGNIYEQSNVFTYNQVPVNTFSTQFDFQLTSAQADGFAFVLHNSYYYYGNGGGDLGYGGGYWPNSVALKFDLYKPTGNHQSSTTGLYFNGDEPLEDGNSIDMALAGINLHNGDIMRVALNYDGVTLNERVTDTVTGATFVQNYKIDIPAILGGNFGYVGFTAATGGLPAVQDILNWTYTPVAAGFAPAAPTVTPNDLTANEGQTINTVVATFIPDTTVGGNLSFEATIDWGDGTTSAGVIAPDGSGGYTITGIHAYGDDGAYPLTIFVVDDRNGAGTLASATATIANVPPTPVFTGPSAGVRGQTLGYTGSFTDPGWLNTWTATVNYGDGSGDQPLALNPNKSFAFNHIYTNTGSYVITVKVTDDDGGIGMVTHAVAVTAVAIQTDHTDPTKTQLVIGGTTGKDIIAVVTVPRTGSVQVFINGVSQGTFKPTGRIIAYGQAGNDIIGVASDCILSTELYGDAGDDALAAGGGATNLLVGGDGNDAITGGGGINSLYGGNGDDILVGGPGSNILVGGDGNDILRGGAGRDILVGGRGADRLNGNGGDDILIAGSTLFDNDPNFFAAVLKEWNRTDLTYTARVTHLQNGGGFNGTYRINATTVLDDSTASASTTADSLTGGAGQDWFLLNATGTGILDNITDGASNETKTDLP